MSEESIEKNIQYVYLLKTSNVSALTVEEVQPTIQQDFYANHHKKTKIIKMITFSSLIISILLFFSGLIIFSTTASVIKNESNITKLERQSELLVGLPGLGFILGSKTSTTWTNQTILQFLGIPFAESPSGKNRYKVPIPKEPWSGVLDTSQNGRPCPEIVKYNNTNFEEYNGDIEDCLNLNVFTKNRNAKQPVMVYIHGGGFTNGSAEEFPPNYLLEKDIVLVVIQYRLGILGFISTQTKEIPGNAAIHDVILSLKWVQKYIKFFGGDPNKVTIFGQSAGAAIVTLLTVSPIVQHKKLFSQIISQSGSIFAPWGINDKPLDLARNTCEKICHHMEKNTCDNVELINDCLMNAEVKELLKIHSIELTMTTGDLGGIIPKRPEFLINDLRLKYPTMIGVTKHDGSFLLATIYDSLLQTGKQEIEPNQLVQLIIDFTHKNIDGSGLINNLLFRDLFAKTDQYGNSFKELIPQFIDLCSLIYFKSPALTFARHNSAFNNDKTFLYSFDYTGEYTRFGYGRSTERYPFYGGVHHSNDYIYLFPYYFKNLNKNDTEIAKNMVEIWTSFAIEGIPSVNGNLTISSLKGTGPYLKINSNITIGKDFTDEFFAATNDPESYKLIKNS